VQTLADHQQGMQHSVLTETWKGLDKVVKVNSSSYQCMDESFDGRASDGWYGVDIVDKGMSEEYE